MKRLCTICARGGSKGIKGKNLRPVNGRPLLAHSVVTARDSGLFDVVAVSSDDPAILDVGRQWGADQLIERPPAMASDTAAKVPAIRHCAQVAEERTGAAFATIVDLDVTAPLRSVEDIRGAIRMVEDDGAPNVVTGAPARRSPYFNLVELDGAGRVRQSKPLAAGIVRRQDSPPCFDLTPSIYVWSRAALFDGPDTPLTAETRLYEMPVERAHDIDGELDFRIVAFLMENPEDPA